MTVTSEGRLANRHPDIVLITHCEEEVHGVNEIIREQFDSFRCIVKDDAVIETINQLKPKVVLFALATVKENITLYTLMIKNQVLNENHYSVLLCNNKESILAFGCCLRNLFNSYFTHQPLYERFRLKLIVFEGLTRCEVEQTFYDELVSVVKNQDSDLNELIELGLSYKKNVLDKLDTSKLEVERIKNEVSKEEQGELKQLLLDKIQTEHLQPLLSSLESVISDNLTTMLAKMMSAHANLQSADVTQNNNLAQALEQFEINEQEEKRILVVEDNHIYREMISDVLSKEGFIIHQVDDGLNAVKKIKTDRYDLILMDLFMPHLNGLKTTKHMRQVGKNKKTPVIALSGNKNKEIVKKWASHGLAGYIVKPSTKAEILTVIKRVLD
ncbi:MAG: response regulator [Pseudomonadota bacterium]|nr:response regulator [Pseudomonadota bacterium]